MDANAAHTSTTLGVLIRQTRERAGLSLRNLEAITGIPRTILNRLELGQLDAPSPHLLQRIAEALELDSDDLFALAGYRPSDKLPSLTPYLRAKYHLPPHALAEANEALQAILERYDRTRQRERPSRP
jgi:transcriptional regulator with XRE-family HTH domain